MREKDLKSHFPSLARYQYETGSAWNPLPDLGSLWLGRNSFLFSFQTCWYFLSAHYRTLKGRYPGHRRPCLVREDSTHTSSLTFQESALTPRLEAVPCESCAAECKKEQMKESWDQRHGKQKGTCMKRASPCENSGLLGLLRHSALESHEMKCISSVRGQRGLLSSPSSPPCQALSPQPHGDHGSCILCTMAWLLKQEGWRMPLTPPHLD